MNRLWYVQLYYTQRKKERDELKLDVDAILYTCFYIHLYKSKYIRNKQFIKLKHTLSNIVLHEKKINNMYLKRMKMNFKNDTQQFYSIF